MAASTVKRAILIAGPTASGKSAVALALAERYGGVIVNADSMQVYADLAVLTARPSPEEMRRAPHRLFGHVDAAEAYSVGRWLSEVRGVLADLAAGGRMPIIVGGTGLYLKALVAGLPEMPAIPPDVRARIRSEASGVSAEALHARLASIDPEMARRLRATDTQRITRALEVLAATGRSLLTFQTVHAEPTLVQGAIAGVFLDVPRAALNARIDRRFEIMMEQGALAEVARLAKRGLDPALPALRALGVPQLLDTLSGGCTMSGAVAAAKLASRHYAKRQVTFARHQLGLLAWAAPGDATAAIERQLAPPHA